MWISTEVLALLIEVTGNPWILLARVWDNEGCRILCPWEIDIKTGGILCLCTFMGMCVCICLRENSACACSFERDECAHRLWNKCVSAYYTPPGNEWRGWLESPCPSVHVFGLCLEDFFRTIQVFFFFFSYCAWYDGAPVIMSQSAVQSELRQFSVKLSSSSSVPVVAPHIAFALLLMWIAIPVTVQYSYAGRCVLWRLYIGYGSRGCCSRSSRVLISAEGIHSFLCQTVGLQLLSGHYATHRFWFCCCGCEYSFPLLYNMLTPYITVKSEEEGDIFTIVCACISILLERENSNHPQ